jgi:uncharacterized protein (DUF58 family)
VIEIAAPAAPQRLDRHRVYILPNASGVTFGAMVLVILIGAINYDNALAYLLAFLLFGLLLVAMLHTYRNLTGLAYHGARASAVFVGDEAVFECHFDNPARLPRLALTIGPWPAGMSREARQINAGFEVELNLPATRLVTTQLRRRAQRRGWLPLGRLRVQSVYPLGLLRAWAYFDGAASCLVYPTPRGDLPLPYATTTISGNAAQFGLGSDEFAGLRPYAPGDPVRAIAWKTLAQGRELMIKRFHGQGATRIVLSWAAVSGLGDLEARVSQLCRWVMDASAAGHYFALELPGLRHDFAVGHEHRDACLRALALFDSPP